MVILTNKIIFPVLRLWIISVLVKQDFIEGKHVAISQDGPTLETIPNLGLTLSDTLIESTDLFFICSLLFRDCKFQGAFLAVVELFLSHKNFLVLRDLFVTAFEFAFLGS